MSAQQELPQVCIVDDDEDIRHSLRLLFEDAGYPVSEAADGQAALDLLRATDECTVVLLDMVMPGGSGLDVLRAAAANDALTTKHAFVLVTATPNVRDIEARRLLRRLRVPVVAKPFDIDELHEVVMQAADRVRLTADGCRVV